MAGHMCASCGKFRSPRYQKHHPLAPGEIPRTGYCRKCAKRATETSGSENHVDVIKAAVRKRGRCKQKSRVRRHSYYSNTSDNDLSSDRIRVFQRPRPRFKNSSRNRAIRVRACSGSRSWHQGYPPRTYQVGDTRGFSSDDIVIVRRTNPREDINSVIFLHQGILDASSGSFSVEDQHPFIPQPVYRRPRVSFENQRSLTEEVTIVPFRKRRSRFTFVEPRTCYERRRVFPTDPAASFFPEDFRVSRTRQNRSESGRRVLHIVRPPTRLVCINGNRQSSAGSIHGRRRTISAPKPHFMGATYEPYRIREFSSTSQVVVPEVASQVGTPVLLSSIADEPIGEPSCWLLDHYLPTR